MLLYKLIAFFIVFFNFTTYVLQQRVNFTAKTIKILTFGSTILSFRFIFSK